MEQPDERLWELDICKCDDGDILLEQGVCWSCRGVTFVRLYLTHIPLVAELAGLRACWRGDAGVERLQDRLRMLVDDLVGG